MIQLNWIFLGVVGLIATVQTIRTIDDQVAIASGLMGTIAWLLWAYSSLHVVVVSNGTEFVYEYPSLAMFGVLMAIPNLFIALTGPLRIAADPRQLAEEVRSP